MKQHRILLFVGYILIGFAIIVTALILFYQASGGYGVDKNGTVIQNGFLHLSSRPGNAEIYLDGAKKNKNTNTRLYLPADIYEVELRRDGYRSWKRTISLEGASVERFDYPVLFPNKLTTNTLDTITGTPAIASQSPDRRWLLTSRADSDLNFSLYDIKNPTKPATTISLPAALASNATTSESWQAIEWADDNQHLLLQHNYDGKLEYILLDSESPAESLNLNVSLSATPAKLTLNNRKYNQYYMWNSDKTLLSVSLNNATPTVVADGVETYKSYGDNSVLYATQIGAVSGKALIKMKIADQTYTIRSVTASDLYLVDLTEYKGVLHVVCGSRADERVYVYRDPINQIKSRASHLAVPVQVLRVTQPNHVKFSNSTQYVMAENGPQFAVYDLLNKKGYNYTMTTPLDAPQTHATWMDGDRLQYVSGGMLLVFDYDKTNARTLAAGSAGFLPMFSPDYKYLYMLQATPVGDNRTALTQTQLVTDADL